MAKEFDTIYQDFREAFLGCRAHFWHGRILQVLGKLSDAKAIYEEVTAHDERNIEEAGDNTRPSPRTRAPRKAGSGNSFADNFFADVEQYYLQTLYLLSTKDYKEYLEEAKTWRTSHKTSSERCYGYQALTLELAKNYLAIGEKSTNAAAKEIAKTTALRLLGEMKKIPSPYQTDAVKLIRLLNPNAGAEEGFEDAVIGGDDAIEKKQWAEATAFYEKAIAVAGPKTDQQRLAAVKDTLVGCYHNQAMQLYRREKVDEAIEMANKALTKKLLGAKTAPGVAVFLLNVRYYQYLGAAGGHRRREKGQGRTAHQGLKDRPVDPQLMGRQGRGRRRADRADAPGPGPGKSGRGRQDLQGNQSQLARVSHGPDGDGLQALVRLQNGQEAN